MINRADVRRGKFCCRECKFITKYRNKCKEKDLTYITHYCHNEQTVIKAKCNKCNTISDYRASSITHHNSVRCETCINKSRQEKALRCGFNYIAGINSYWALYECIYCGLYQKKRFTDVANDEARCECRIKEKNEEVLEKTRKNALNRGFMLVKKVDHTWCIFRCMACGEEYRYQYQAMENGNVACKTASCRNKSRGQKLLEEYLFELGFKEGLLNEVSFDDLRGEKGVKLRYDIGYYQDGDLKWLIEFDGIQHEKPVRFKSEVTEDEAIKRFELQKKYDQLKNEYAIKIGIPLLRISYTGDYITNKWKEKVKNFLASTVDKSKK